MSQVAQRQEGPILMSSPMVRSTLADTKTQTRRVVKTVGHDGGFVLVERSDGSLWPQRSDDGESGFVTLRERGRDCLFEIPMRCPYGQPGDQLWLREAWSAPHAFDHLPPRLIPQGARIHYAATEDRGGLLWRPSIHMPRWASRITLEVTGVRVERLLDISEADAKAEGAPSADLASGRVCIFPHQGTHRWGFRLLWESINGPGSWEANQWVWCVSFKRIRP